MSIWKSAATLTELNQKIANSMAGNLGIAFTEIGDDFLKASMPLNEKTRQNMGIMHGGANVVLAETTANIAAVLCCDADRTVVGLEISANHLRPGMGTVTAVTKPLHIGRTTMVWEIKIYNAEHKLTCVTRFTGSVIPL